MQPTAHTRPVTAETKTGLKAFKVKFIYAYKHAWAFSLKPKADGNIKKKKKEMFRIWKMFT